MTAFALIPVFNRLSHTQAIIDCLRRQRNVDLCIVVVDDGSTDGTSEFLAQQPDVVVLEGDGSLWWAGAMRKAQRVVQQRARPGDFFLFINNDTRIGDDFVTTLIKISIDHGRAVVGSVMRGMEPPHDLLGVSPLADLWQFRIWDSLHDLSKQEREQLQEVYPADFLPGRNTLFPVEVLTQAGALRPWLLPHYYSDYEYADRVRRAGFSLMLSTRAVTLSPDEGTGNQRRYASYWQRKFGKGSPENIFHKQLFFISVGTPAQRLTALPRMAYGNFMRSVWFPLRGFLLQRVHEYRCGRLLLRGIKFVRRIGVAARRRMI